MQQIAIGEYERTLLGGEGDPLGIVSETEVWPERQMTNAKTKSSPGK